MESNDRAALVAEQTRLQQHRFAHSCADGRAYTNGTIDRIDRELARIRNALAALPVDA